MSGGITPTGREGRSGRLDADPELVATLDVGNRLDGREAERCAAHLADIAPGTLARIDEALIPQPFQRGSQHGARDTELLGERLLRRQLLVRRIVAVRDPAVDQVIDPVCQSRAGGPRRLGWRLVHVEIGRVHNRVSPVLCPLSW